ncbi:MAG TPA: hypothetical protein VIT44_18085 [Cyclobacteriaceae bacterium]
MSIIRYNELSISEMIEESTLIVEVELVGPFQEEVPIVNRDLKEGSAIPPFIKKGHTFKVKNVLKNKGDQLPEQINVPNENWRRSLSQHKEQHAGGPSKSFTVPEYKSDVKSIAKATVLFLNHFQGMYDLTAANAFENNAALEKINMLLNPKKIIPKNS